MIIKRYLFKTDLSVFCLCHERIPDHMPSEFVQHELEEKDIDVVAQGYRAKSLIYNRLQAGQAAFWLEKEGKCACVFWTASENYFVWDIRAKILLQPGSLYAFDIFTHPLYRKQGLLRASIFKFMSDHPNISSLFILVRRNNAEGLAAFRKSGFVELARVALTQIPPFRKYCIVNGNSINVSLKFMRLRNEPAVLTLESSTSIF